jgi:hypothetical protein
LPIIDRIQLLGAICPPLDEQLARQLLDEFVSQEQRYVLRDWEPATLDGGQFTEAAARILYHQDSQNLNRRRSVDRCLSYIEDPTNNNAHHYPDRKSALHSARVLRTIYKFRSDRGAVHIDPTYSANHLDSKLVIENVRWVLAELLRTFWTGDRGTVAAAIRELVQYEVPSIAEFDGRLLVQRTDLCAEDEISLLLHYAGEAGLSRGELGRFVEKTPSAVTRGLQKLTSARAREVIRLSNGNYRLTDLGIRRVLSDLAQKLLLQT